MQSHSSEVTENSWTSFPSRVSRSSDVSVVSRHSWTASTQKALPPPRKTWSWLQGARQPSRSSTFGASSRVSAVAATNKEEAPPSSASWSISNRNLSSSVVTRLSLADAAHGLDGGNQQGNIWASLFGIRVKLTPDHQRRLLGMTRENEWCSSGWYSESTSSGHNTSSRMRKLFAGRSVSKLLQWLASFSVALVPMLLSATPACGLASEREMVSIARVVHFVAALVYAFVGFAQFWAASKPLPGRMWAQRLRRRHFYCDLIASVGIVTDLAYLIEAPSSVPSWCELLWLLHMVKIWRPMGPTFMTSAELRGITVQILILFMELVLAAHTFACIFVWIAIHHVRNGAATWADPLLENRELESCVELYTASLYFCTYTLTSIGYGDLVPANVVEHVICVFFMLVSQMFAAKVFAQLTWITATHQHWKAQHHARLTQTVGALDSMGVHPDLYERVLAYQDFIEEMQKERRAQECLRDLSRPLREELRLVVHYDLVSQAPFLQAQPTFLVRNIIAALSDVVYLPCDVIIRRGDMGDELFFLRSGCAGVFTSEELPNWTDVEVMVLGKGTYFGEVSLLTGQPRSSWVIARTYCMCSVLPKHVIDNIMADNPACIKGLVSSLKSVLHLKPLATWADIGNRIKKEFENEMFEDSEGFVYEFTCSGEDGEAPAGLITWARFNILMQRLHISPLDRKLFWVELDEDSEGVVPFAQFWARLTGNGDTSRSSSPVNLQHHDEESASPTSSLCCLPEGTSSTTSKAPELPKHHRKSVASVAGSTYSVETANWVDGERFTLRNSLSPPKRNLRRKSSMAPRASRRASTTWSTPLPTLLLTPDPVSAEAKQERMLADIVKRVDSMENKVNTLADHLNCLDEHTACGN